MSLLELFCHVADVGQTFVPLWQREQPAVVGPRGAAQNCAGC